MIRFRWAVMLAVVTSLVGAIASAVPAVGALEDSLGLRWLFLMRGSLKQPANVAIVSLDETAAVRMELPMTPRDWPRSVHATLIDRLGQFGAAAIAFDMQFVRRSASPLEDEAFAHAMTRAGRVALVQRLEVAHVNQQTAWQQQDPIPPLSAAAAALVPAPLPSGVPVSWSWTFVQTPNRGEVPSLAAAALQLYALPTTDRFVEELRDSGIRGLPTLPEPASAIRASEALLA